MEKHELHSVYHGRAHVRQYAKGETLPRYGNARKCEDGELEYYIGHCRETGDVKYSRTTAGAWSNPAQVLKHGEIVVNFNKKISPVRIAGLGRERYTYNLKLKES